MRIGLSKHAHINYESLSPVLQRATEKQFSFLAANIRHPSLHAKKYDEATGLWQARITRDWRFYFLISSDVYFVVSIRKHPK